MFKKGDLVEIKRNDHIEFRLGKQGTGIGVVTGIDVSSWVGATYLVEKSIFHDKWIGLGDRLLKYPENMRLYKEQKDLDV